MTEPRKLLCRSGGAFTREAVYQASDGLDVDQTEHYEVVRRRVLYDDVSLVTFHSDRGFWYLFATAGIGGLFTFMGMLIAGIGPNSWPASIMFFAFGIPALVMFFIRLMFGRDVITIFGRRSRAVLRFGGFRRKRARTVYGEICAAVRRAQSAARPAEPAPAPAIPAGVPMPPSE